MRRYSLLHTLLWAALAGPVAGAAQQPTSIPVREALVDLDGDRIPDRRGDTVVVEGILTSDALVAGAAAALVNFQDRSAGALLFTRDTSLLSGLLAGDSLRIRGYVEQYRGTEEIVVDAYERLGRTTVPEPRDVLVADLQGERFSGRLVRLEGNLRTTLTEGDWIQARLEDRTGSIPLHISAAWLTNPEFVQRLSRGGRVKLIGVSSQNTRSTPPFDGYRIVPRGSEDFAFAPRPPYDLLIAGAVIALIIALLLWRRSAVQRARKLERLASELERSREEIRIREARYRSLVENAMDTVSILDADGMVLYQGPSITRMMGWLPEELEGRSAFEHVHPEDRPRVKAIFGDLPQEPNGSRDLELRFQATDGSWHDLEVICSNRVHDPAVRGIVCNVRDVTHHRALENRLRQADRLETVGRLAGGIAHDFNNILTALRGHADMALEQISAGGAGHDEVLQIVRNTDRASAVTRHLLAFTRQQVQESRLVSASPIIRNMIPTLRRLIGAAVEISVDLCDQGDVIEADPAQIEQVVLNLVINARDAIAEGGRITLQVAEDEITEAWSAKYPYSVETGRYVRISVIDTGAGMDEDVLSHVFEPFFTTKQPGQGTGLGLASVYGIVKQSRGYIWAHSDPGAGTRFDVFLPRVDSIRPDPSLEEPAQESGLPVAVGSGETILLVEDEEAVRKLAALVLRKNGYRVLEASRAEEALRLVDTHFDIDILLTDVIMPGMSGTKLAALVSERLPNLPVILMSGYTAGEVGERAVSAGPALLEKPFSPQQLLHHVGDCLQRQALRTGL